MEYKKVLDAEKDFALKLRIAQGLLYNEVRRYIDKEGKDKFTLEVWDRIYKKYEGTFSKANKSFVNLIGKLKR